MRSIFHWLLQIIRADKFIRAGSWFCRNQVKDGQEASQADAHGEENSQASE
jgi:hypothetical protein